ncbi:MAG: T9SS type A sorting domain-containing protein [Bacteroidetes bacterium]|nr:T9SS type A sorting domain-containing protein [Bacteroidota bacterium]
MKRKAFYALAGGLLLFIIVLGSFGDGEGGYSTGAPPGNTNSPGDGQNCTHCMGGTATPVTGWITSDVPSAGYKNDSVYTITVTATGAGNKGFEVSPQDLAGNLVGTLFAGTGSQLVGSGKYITHTTPKTGASATWTFTWQAPSTGNNDITFYGSIAVTKPQTNTTTLTITKNTVGMIEQGVADLTLYPNPVRDKIVIEMQLPKAGDLRIELLNMRGLTVAILLDEYSPSGAFSRKFAVNRPAGMYFLRIKTDNGLLTKKLIVE